MESPVQVLRNAAERGCLSSFDFETWLAGIDHDPVLLLIIGDDLFLSKSGEAVVEISGGNIYGISSLLRQACDVLTLWCDVRQSNIDPTPLRVLVDVLTDHAMKRKRFLPDPRQQRVQVQALEHTFAVAQRVIDRISNLARHKIRSASPPRGARRGCRLNLHPTNGVALLDGEPFDVKPKQYELLSLLINANGEYTSLDGAGLRTRDVEALPLKIREVIESQPGAGTRIKPEFWLS